MVYDLAPPYEANWAFFQHVRVQGWVPPAAFVLTSTNTQQLERLVGPTGSLLVVGKPFDLDKLVDAVRHALAITQGER